MNFSRTSLPPASVAVLALGLIGLIGAFDYVTGRDLAVSAFYLAPICWVTWEIGRRAGLVFALLGTGAWYGGDALSGYGYAHPAIPLWNALMLFSLFTVTVVLLSAVRQAHAHLEETVASRTLALRQEMEERRNAEEAKLQAERLAMVGTMAAQVAHEVRNPLGAMVLNLDLLAGEMETLSGEAREPVEESRELVSNLRSEVRRIERVINDYLALARSRRAELKPLEVNTLLREKLHFVRGVFAEAGVTLELRLAPQPLWVSADADQLWQAILNLSRNGLEAMTEGGVFLVETSREAESCLIRLTDNGAGMTPEQQERLFVPFASEKAKGTGLGLAVVSRIVAEHLGRIECRSARGAGTIFTVTLPLTAAAAPPLSPLPVPSTENLQLP